ncbi:MAG: winged helix-turn-helix domain-containing protein [Candidatus Woesearchaeota archaeon]
MRRNRIEILINILEVAYAKGERIKPTHLLYKSNLSHARMKKYVEELKAKGLLAERFEDGRSYFSITEKGIAFLAEYKKVRELTEAFGL